MKKQILSCIAIIFTLSLFVLYLTSDKLLNEVSNFLIHKEPLESADAIVVLSGSGTGIRIRAGAMLFQKGLGKIIVISGNEIYPGYYNECREYIRKLP